MMRHNSIEAKETIRTGAEDVAYHYSEKADLTPCIVREGVSGVISAQWSSLHWMEAVLRSSQTIASAGIVCRPNGAKAAST